MGACAAFVAAMILLGGGARAAAQPQVQAPQPTVPEIFTLMGEFVRIAYNNQGFVTMGYRMAQESVGQDWILLEVGITLRGHTKNLKLKRAT